MIKLQDYIFDQIFQKDKSTSTNFDSTDLFLINSNKEFYPWFSKYKILLQLLKLIILSNKNCLLLGPISLSLPYILSTNGISIDVFNNKGRGGLWKDIHQQKQVEGLMAWHAFWEYEKGYIQLYDRDKKEWIGFANTGFNKMYDNVQKFYKSKEINSKNVCRVQFKNQHSQITKNMRTEQIDLKQETLFQINNFKISDQQDKSFDVLADHPHGKCLFAQGNVVGSIFTLDRSEYSEVLMHNFLEQSYSRLVEYGCDDSLKINQLVESNLSIQAKIHLEKNKEVLYNSKHIQCLFQGCHVNYNNIVKIKTNENSKELNLEISNQNSKKISSTIRNKYLKDLQSPILYAHSGSPSSPNRKLFQCTDLNDSSAKNRFIVSEIRSNKNNNVINDDPNLIFNFDNNNQKSNENCLSKLENSENLKLKANESNYTNQKHQNKSNFYLNQEDNYKHLKTFEDLKLNNSNHNSKQDTKSLLDAMKNFKSHQVRSRPNTKEMSRINLNSQKLNLSDNFTDFIFENKNEKSYKSVASINEFKKHLNNRTEINDEPLDDDIHANDLLNKKFNSSTGIRRSFQNNKKRLVDSLTQAKFNPWDGQGPTVQGQGPQIENPQHVDRVKPEGKEHFKRFFGNNADRERFISNYVGATPNSNPITIFNRK